MTGAAIAVLVVTIFGPCHSGGDSLTVEDALGREYSGVVLARHPRLRQPLTLLPRRMPGLKPWPQRGFPNPDRVHQRTIVDPTGLVFFSRTFTESEVPPAPPFELRLTCLERAFDAERSLHGD